MSRLRFVRGIAVAVDETDRDRLIPASIRRCAAPTTSFSCSGSTIVPSAAMRSATSSRYRRGTSGFGFDQVRSNISGIRIRPISSTSRNPRVVIRPARPTVATGYWSRRRAVEHLGDVAGRNCELVEQCSHSQNDRGARIGGRGRDLAFVQDPVARHQHDVRESAADIHGNSDGGDAGHVGAQLNGSTTRAWRRSR